ncbi:3-hydroxyacyl-ACP dehydratase [Ramlibacter terrae]|uniref:3-hydroxyacyl-ACP dehydratase n=1 Tax=Ramlibacter terrae TaxID=2732511 RepID=A0ABX6P225_9BURK|nr:3-hydroxyacyl-ACP dehydratase [Ramlibacter terrae]
MGLESTLEFAADHPAFAGHFPGAPIVPGVLLLDAALHALEGAGLNPTGIASAKFLQPVAPAQALVLACTPAASGRCAVSIARAGEPVAVAQVQAAA